jgi:hypothetical protein
VHGVSSSIVATHDYDWISIDFQCEVVAPFWDFAGMAGEEPAAAPNLIHVATVDILGGIKLTRERPAWLAPCEK